MQERARAIGLSDMLEALVDVHRARGDSSLASQVCVFVCTYIRVCMQASMAAYARMRWMHASKLAGPCDVVEALDDVSMRMRSGACVSLTRPHYKYCRMS